MPNDAGLFLGNHPSKDRFYTFKENSKFKKCSCLIIKTHKVKFGLTNNNQPVYII